MSLRTTAIYPNRVADKARIEAALGLEEFGNETTEFRTKLGTLFAMGYVRVVYGDHGPYVEFEPRHIRTRLRRKFNRPLPARCFYEWLEPEDGSHVKVYDQKKEVRNLKNPPPGGFRGDRPEGYADYRIGCIYVAPEELSQKSESKTEWALPEGAYKCVAT
jgi:hypothetical protein